LRCNRKLIHPAIFLTTEIDKAGEWYGDFRRKQHNTFSKFAQLTLYFPQLIHMIANPIGERELREKNSDFADKAPYISELPPLDHAIVEV
jgi:hypothetical protein